MTQISSSFLQDAHRYYEILSSRSRSNDGDESQSPSTKSGQRRLRTQRSIEEAKEFCLRSEYLRTFTTHPNGKPQKRIQPNVVELSTRLEHYLKLSLSPVVSRDLAMV